MDDNSKTYRVALDIALTEMTVLLTEARDYLHNPEYPLAVLGTLHSFDEKAEDVKAALRLYANALRTERRTK